MRLQHVSPSSPPKNVIAASSSISCGQSTAAIHVCAEVIELDTDHTPHLSMTNERARALHQFAAHSSADAGRLALMSPDASSENPSAEAAKACQYGLRGLLSPFWSNVLDSRPGENEQSANAKSGRRRQRFYRCIHKYLEDPLVSSNTVAREIRFACSHKRRAPTTTRMDKPKGHPPETVTKLFG